MLDNKNSTYVMVVTKHKEKNSYVEGGNTFLKTISKHSLLLCMENKLNSHNKCIQDLFGNTKLL